MNDRVVYISRTYEGSYHHFQLKTTNELISFKVHSNFSRDLYDFISFIRSKL